MTNLHLEGFGRIHEHTCKERKYVAKQSKRYSQQAADLEHCNTVIALLAFNYDGTSRHISASMVLVNSACYCAKKSGASSG